MLNPAHEIHEAQNVHELLLSTVKQVRALHATLSALMTDVAAIRRTFLQGRGDMARYKDNLRSAIETAKPIVDEAMQSYDEMIGQIQASEGWRNWLFGRLVSINKNAQRLRDAASIGSFRASWTCPFLLR